MKASFVLVSTLGGLVASAPVVVRETTEAQGIADYCKAKHSDINSVRFVITCSILAFFVD